MVVDIEKVIICIYEVCFCIIDKKGLFNNLVDCDYCIQYMVVVLLLFGWLIVVDYEDEVVQDKCIDVLCEKIVCYEDLVFIVDYYDLEKCVIGNVIIVEFIDGLCFGEVVVEYLIGYVCCCVDGILKFIEKFKINLVCQFLICQQ